MTRSPLLLLLGLSVLLLAAALRFPALSQRPLHGDESLNVVKFRTLWQRGEYVYDPHEFHGPLLPYASLPWVAPGHEDWQDTAEADYRRVTAFFGVAVVASTLLGALVFSPAAACLGALLAAVSTVMVFYSRYYIHEMPLVLFSALTLAALAWCMRRPTPWRAAAVGCGIGAMHATKETALLAWFAMALALVVVGFYRRRRPTKADGMLLLALFGGFVMVSVTLFSSFFTHWPGVVDSFVTFARYFERGTGGEPLHLHPWWWYFQRIGWFRMVDRAPLFTELFVLLLSLVGAVTAWRQAGPRRDAARLVVVYTFALAAVYAVIPYKTPWCLLGFWHGMLLLSGVGAVRLFTLPRPAFGRAAVAGLLLAGAVHLGIGSYRANFLWHTRRFNPWVYAHPNGNIRQIPEALLRLAEVHPLGHDLRIRVVAEPGVENNLWPLPFYLRQFPNTTYLLQPPVDADAPVLLVPPPMDSLLVERFGDHYVGPHNYGVRPGVVVARYVHAELWNRFMLQLEQGPSASKRP